MALRAAGLSVSTIPEASPVGASWRKHAAAAACAALLAAAPGGTASAQAPEPAAPPSSTAPPPAPTLTQSPDGSLRIDNASLEDALRLAQGWIDDEQPALAEQLLGQVGPIWPDDARIPFLRGLAARAQGDGRAAVDHFRAALDLDPDADRARYELANTYTDLRNWDQATFHYRFVLGSDAPDPVKVDVASRIIAISDRRRWTASFEAALAPSTNINVAPSDAVIDPIFNADNPAVLTGESTAQSGLGVRAAGGAVRQLALTRWDGPNRRVRAQVGASASVTDYDDARFDDAAASLVAGATLRQGRSVIGTDVRTIRRWYGGEAYEDAVVARLFHDRRIAAPLALRLEASVAERDNQVRDDQDGEHYRASGRLQLNVSGSSLVYAEASGSRFDTSARATSFWEGGLAVGVYKDFRQGWSVDLSPSYLRREHDGPDPFFLRTQDDSRWSLAGSVIKRDFELFGFAPFARYRYTTNDSTLKLHAFEQHSAEFGFTGVF
jgi:hypothetical protein